MSSLPALVVAAPLRMEARALRRGAPALRVVRTGVGPERARRAAERLRAEPAQALGVAGLCGSVDAALAPGDVVVASALTGADHDTAVDIGLESPAFLCGALRAAGFRVRSGVVASVDHLVRGAERERIREQGVLAVDMESAWLAPGAAGRRLAVVRVVMDAPGRELLRLATPAELFRALRTLRRVAPILESWGRASAPVTASPLAGGER